MGSASISTQEDPSCNICQKLAFLSHHRSFLFSFLSFSFSLLLLSLPLSSSSPLLLLLLFLLPLPPSYGTVSIWPLTHLEVSIEHLLYSRRCVGYLVVNKQMPALLGLTFW